MKLDFRCPERYLEAIQKSRELNDTTLYECISRLAIYITPRPWQIEEAKKIADKMYDKYDRAYELFYRCQNDKISERALRNKWRYWDKYLAARDKYNTLVTGGQSTVVISGDRSDLSFYFYELREDGTQGINGGIIFHRDHWEIHT